MKTVVTCYSLPLVASSSAFFLGLHLSLSTNMSIPLGFPQSHVLPTLLLDLTLLKITLRYSSFSGSDSGWSAIGQSKVASGLN